MKESFFPKALWFKEWRDFRWYLILVGLVIAGRAVLPVVMTLKTTNEIFLRHALTWNVLMPNIYGITLNGPNSMNVTFTVNGLPSASILSGFLATVLGILLWNLDRNRGSLIFVMTGPARRDVILRVKSALAALVLIVADLIAFGSYLCADAMAHMPISWRDLVTWLALNVIVQVALLTTSMAMATVCGSGLVAGISAVIVALYPAFIGRLVKGVPGPSGVAVPLSHQAQPLSVLIGQVISQFSPLQYFIGQQSTTYTGTLGNQPMHYEFQTAIPHTPFWPVFLLMWMVVWYTLTLVLLKVAEVESFDRFFVVPAVWPWAIAAISGLTAYEVSYLSVHNSFVTNTGFLTRFALMACVVFVGLTLLRRTFRTMR